MDCSSKCCLHVALNFSTGPLFDVALSVEGVKFIKIFADSLIVFSLFLDVGGSHRCQYLSDQSLNRNFHDVFF